MARISLLSARWLGVVCLFGGVAWACGSGDTNPFNDASHRGSGGASGSGATGGSTAGGTAGESSGGAPTGGASTGGNMGEGGAAAEGGTSTGGAPAGGTDGMGGTPSGGSAGAVTGGSAGGGMGGTGGRGGAGGSGGRPMGGDAGLPSAGSGGSGGTGGHACKANGDCTSAEYCRKTSCDASEGRCTARGPECSGTSADFDPICGCDGMTYYNTCVIEHEGFNVASRGECTGDNRPTCTRDGGPADCPPRIHAHCYRTVEQCGDPSPTMGVCWVMPQFCPPNEGETQRYCGGTAGVARCISLCEVIDAENSFRRDAPQCEL